jgi:2-hydroxy-6-oxonona-2,4-dienedioate hydrolase
LKHHNQTIRVFYTDIAGPHANAPVIALLHGSGPGSSGLGSFVSNHRALLDAGFRLIYVDMPGWGLSDPLVCTEDRSVLNAKALEAVLNAAQVKRPVHILGASMGAHSAVAFALLCPERTARLVLVAGGTGGRSSYQPQMPEGVRAMLDFYETPIASNMRAFLKAVFHEPRTVTEEFVDAMLKAALSRPEHLANFSESLDLYPRHFGDVSGRLPEIQSPTLVVWGSEDRFVPLDIGLQIATRVPRADLYLMGRTGHVPHIEQPGDFNRMVCQFLSASA